MRALVVDDSEPVRKRLLDLFAENRIEMQEARDAAEALELLATEPVDVVVLDVRLGAQSGLDLICDVKARKPDVIVVVLTNEVSAAHRRECLLRGADFFFDKSRQFEHAAGVVVRGERACR